MKMGYRYSTICVGILLLACVFFKAGVSAHAGPLELNASIMEINLKNEMMVVAEKKIHLLTSVQNGKKVWKTVFMDSNGTRISANQFTVHDRVLVKGVYSGPGTVEASEIILLAPKSVPLPPR